MKKWFSLLDHLDHVRVVSLLGEAGTQKACQPQKHPHYLYLSQIDRSCQICNETSLAIPPFAKRDRPSLLGFGKI